VSRNSDPYLYLGTAVLRNLAGLRDPKQLKDFETANTAKRITQLQLHPVNGPFDPAHLRALHYHIFQDVYPWAGNFRTVRLGKPAFEGDLPNWFIPPERLEQEATRICDQLARTNLLRRLSRADFSHQAARLLADLNSLHPFREGNGRTQRQFISDLTRTAGHRIDFSVVSEERMIQASIEAFSGQPAMLIRLFDEITDSERIIPLKRTISFLDSHNYNWNNVYISIATPGEHYSGTLVGRDNDAFMLRSDSKTIVIGRTVDLDPTISNGQRCSFRASNPHEHAQPPTPDKGVKKPKSSLATPPRTEGRDR
jgi:cell filamentation protein